MKKYLITSPKFYTDTSSTFRDILYQRIKLHHPEYVLFRDKSNPNYESLAKDFTEVCNQFIDVKSFLHQNLELASSLGAYGVHLTSIQFDSIKQAKKKNLEVIISTHTHDEVLKAEELGADAVTYSPIFTSPGKGRPKGIEDLKTLLDKCNIKVFALGGIITKEHIQLLQETNSYGYASIRLFHDN